MAGAELERGAEIADLGLALVREQDVPRLDVAVDDAVGEGVLERADRLEDDLDHLVQRQQRGDAGVRLERRAGHVLHHQVAVVGLDHRVVDLDDVRVVEPAGERGLGDEGLVLHALVLRVGVAVEQKHLDRDVAPAERVARGYASWAHCRFRAGAGIFPVLLRLELHISLRWRRNGDPAAVGLLRLAGNWTTSWRLAAMLLGRAQRDHDVRMSSARIAARLREVEAVRAISMSTSMMAGSVSPSARAPRGRPSP
jgi:hypothetical protein